MTDNKFLNPPLTGNRTTCHLGFVICHSAELYGTRQVCIAHNAKRFVHQLGLKQRYAQNRLANKFLQDIAGWRHYRARVSISEQAFDTQPFRER
jgi:hypothetical protein